MNEYILKQDVLNLAKPYFFEDEDGFDVDWLFEGEPIILKHEIETISPADVRSVPKGQWISFDAESEKCSHCKRRYYISALFAIGGNNEPDFCPGCGADIKEVK